MRKGEPDSANRTQRILKIMTTKETAKNKYYEAVGRRKESVARVRITEAKSNSFSVNDKKVEDYFPNDELRAVAQEALKESGLDNKFSVSVLTSGGGVSSQAASMRHGISRALVLFNEDTKSNLKKAGFLKRDSRAVERKKPGRKKARKSPQWSKR